MLTSIFLSLPATVAEIVIVSSDLDMRGLFSSHSFSQRLKTLHIVNVRKKPICFDEKEIDALCNYLPNLEDVLFSGCSLTNSILQMISERLRRLKKLKIDNCDGYDNQALSCVALHCKQLEALCVGGSEMTYNTKLSYESLLAFKKNPAARLKQVTFNYCSKIGKKAVDAICERFR